MKTTNSFAPMSDRYRFDFRLCKPSNGWAQLDTRQDASYHGIWVNPLTREYCSYVEGDVTHIQCEDDAEFTAMLRETIAWHKEREYFIGIDACGIGEIKAAFIRLGFGDHLH